MGLEIMGNFECCRCGRCCTNLRTLNQEPKDQKLIFRLPDNDKIGLPLWQWEAEEVKKSGRINKKVAIIQQLHI